MRTKSKQIRKSPLLVLLGLGIWGLLAWIYNPLLLPLFDMSHTFIIKVLVFLVILWINVVWLYGVIHVLTVIFSLLVRDTTSRNPPPSEYPPVAVLYTTCNDFSLKAAESCVHQSYPFFKVFLLDDSTDPQEIARVEDFWKDNQEQCILIRRKVRRAYKAGNLNHALEEITEAYPYFAAVDSDEILPRDFLAALMPHFKTDSRIGFVQANHRYRQDCDSEFEKSMTAGVDLHWDLFLPSKNKYGFVMFYGHGAVIRSEVWRKMGGFPEVVSEDIAFAARARELGYHGVFERDVVAEESFPRDYTSFLKREVKVVKGTLQFLLGPARSFFSSPRVTVIEKLDLLGSALVLFLPLFFMGFVISANIILPLLVGLLNSIGSGIGAPLWYSILEPFGAGVRGLWTWDFYLVTVVSILSPLAYQLRAFLRSPWKLGVYAARSTSVYLSIVPTIAWEIVAYIGQRRVEFLVTGDRGQKPASAKRARLVYVAAIGLTLAGCAILIHNYAVLTIALAFLLHPVFLKWRAFGTGIALTAAIPFVFFVVVFGSIPFLLLGLTGALAASVPAHH